MAAIHLAYLFDVESYWKITAPMIPRMEQNDFDLLQSTAEQMLGQRPAIWNTLENHRFYATDQDIGGDHQFSVRFWMMTVLAFHWQPVQTPRRYVRSITLAMRQNNMNEDVIVKLTSGKSLCSLLQPQLVSDPINQRSSAVWPFWSYYDGMGGWLDRLDIDDLLRQLTPLNVFFDKDLETEKGLDLQPITACQAALRMLSAAQQANHGLFLAIVD
jgi:hypothetical protein